MKKYFLTIIGESKFNTQSSVDIGLALGEIVDSKFLNFNYNESFIIFHFESSVNKEDMFTFIRGVLYGITDTFVLTEMNDNFSISLPDQLGFIFDLENNEQSSKKVDIFIDNEYDMEDEDDELYYDIMEKYRKNIKKAIPKMSLDSLLDKINEKGINSLNETERKTLESYSK